MQLQTLQYEIRVKVSFTSIINKSPLVGDHAFSLMEIGSWMAHSTIIYMNSRCVVTATSFFLPHQNLAKSHHLSSGAKD